MTDNKYFYIYPFCFITKGVRFFSIYDSLHNKIHQFDIDLYDIANNQFREKTVNNIFNQYNSEDKNVIQSFISYLAENKLGRYVDNIQHFPLLKEQWDAPYKIKRCIIDVRDVWHNFDLIFMQLAELLCPKIELRVYRPIKLEEIESVVRSFQKFDFGILFLLIPFRDELFMDESIEKLSNILSSEFRIIINVYDTPSSKELIAKNAKEKFRELDYSITTSTKKISGRDDCGVINHKKFHELDIAEIMENKHHSGCLNRLISIDEDGLIRNCPSMPVSYGHVNTTSLLDISKNDEFRKFWYISNSKIKVCKDCDLRIICQGCRAYLSDSSNLFSKPLKCDYIP